MRAYARPNRTFLVVGLAPCLLGADVPKPDPPKELPKGARVNDDPKADREHGEHGGKPAGKLPGPRPEYKPEQVVQIVMDVLQNNDADDSGIAVTFNFASPDNKKVTGPLERFVPMVKTPAYRPMIGCKEVSLAKPVVTDDQAVQAVTVTAADGAKVQYVFLLSKQPDGEFKGCWMTDGVFRVEPRKPEGKPVGNSAGPQGGNGRYRT